MKALSILPGYLLAALLLGYGWILSERTFPAGTPFSTSSKADEFRAIVEPGAQQLTETELNRLIQERRLILADLREKLKAAPQIAAPEERLDYDSFKAEAMQQVAEDMQKLFVPVIGVPNHIGYSEEFNNEQGRHRTEQTIGAFLQELKIGDPLQRQIIDALVVNAAEQRALERARLSREMSPAEFQQKAAQKSTRNVLARYVDDFQISRYDEYEEQQDQAARRKKVEKLVNGYGFGLSDASKRLVIDRLASAYSRDVGRGPQTSLDDTLNRIRAVDDAEQELTLELSEADMARIRFLLDYERARAIPSRQFMLETLL